MSSWAGLDASFGFDLIERSRQVVLLVIADMKMIRMSRRTMAVLVMDLDLVVVVDGFVQIILVELGDVVVVGHRSLVVFVGCGVVCCCCYLVLHAEHIDFVKAVAFVVDTTSGKTSAEVDAVVVVAAVVTDHYCYHSSFVVAAAVVKRLDLATVAYKTVACSYSLAAVGFDIGFAWAFAAVDLGWS
jgi:hypothetical protein